MSFSMQKVSDRKSTLAFRTIGEVAEELDLQPHVLRFWEGKFSQISPQKRRGGHRYYKPEDVEAIREIKTLLYDRGFTIKGVQKYFKNQKNPKSDLKIASNNSMSGNSDKLINNVLKDLLEIKKLLS